MIKRFILKILQFLFPNQFVAETSSDSHNNLATRKVLFREKPLMTPNEYDFYLKLKKIELKGDYLVQPQVNLASIVDKISTDRYRNELYRNIDFVIFDKEYNKALLLIELNDQTHKQKSRNERDKKVKLICEQANLKLLFFYSSYANKEDYIINRCIENMGALDNADNSDFPIV